jgi:hypothetical protein
LFIELTYFGTDQEFIVNKNHIVDVYRDSDGDCVVADILGHRETVKESYEEVKSLLNIQSENVIL